MNRRERKKMEKELGISKYTKTLSRTAKFERIKTNQESGKKLQEDLKQNNQILIQKQDDLKESNVIETLANSIYKRTKIPYIDAIEIAKSEYNKTK